MALLGAQLVITLIMVSVIQKLGNYSFARWLLCSQGLYRYLYPDNSELKTLAGVPKEKPKGKKSGKHESNGKPETFHVPRSLDLQLETAPVTHLDVVHLRFYTEYIWIVDFSLYTAIVYIMSEIYTSIFPLKDEFNLSMVWCLLVVLFSLYPFIYPTNIINANVSMPLQQFKNTVKKGLLQIYYTLEDYLEDKNAWI